MTERDELRVKVKMLREKTSMLQVLEASARIGERVLAMDEYHRDDMMVVVAGSPPGVSGNTNMIHVHLLGEDTRVPK